MTAWREAKVFFLAATEDETTGHLNSLLTAFTTTRDQMEAFCAGRLSSSKQMKPHPLNGQSACLYIPILIVGDRLCVPRLFRSIARDINAQMEPLKISSEVAFATAADKRSKLLLTKQGFRKIAAHRDEYDIMVARRAESVILGNWIY